MTAVTFMGRQYSRSEFAIIRAVGYACYGKKSLIACPDESREHILKRANEKIAKYGIMAVASIVEGGVSVEPK